MKPTKKLQGEFEAKLKELLRTTDASRVTVRLDAPERHWHVDDVVAEARRRGVHSLRHQTSIDQRKAPTVIWLDRERRLLIQEDLRSAEPAPPQELVATYGTTAQMLGPLVKDDKLVGWISVHHNGGTRKWLEHEIAALEQTVNAIQRQI
jgi:maleate isomerase